MTRFTPECLARTDFPRLIRADSSSSRERLEALVTDPEALHLYGEELAARGVAGRRLIDEPGWDDLRRRILREGLGASNLDDQTLDRLAQDFEALAELQFDLFSTEPPRGPWKKWLAHEAAGGEYPERDCKIQLGAQAGDREALARTATDLPGPDNSKAEAKGGDILEPSASPGPDGSPHRMPPAALVGNVEGVLRCESRHGHPGTRLDFQRCLVDRRGWLHWSSHHIDHPTGGPQVLLLVHCDTRAEPDPTTFDEGLEWAWPTLDSLASACSPLPSPGGRPHAPGPRRCRHACRREESSWLRWIRRRVPFLRTRVSPCGELGCDARFEHLPHFSGSFSTFDLHGTGERARSIVVVVDAAVELAIEDVIRRGGPDPATGIGVERYMDSYRPPDDRSPLRQLPAPKPPWTSRRELARTV